MVKIHITGNAGSGKTTFAARLGHLLDVPVYGLDDIVWEPRWVKPPTDVSRAKIQELVAKPNWVIEGVSPHIRQAADVTVFLDLPRAGCFWRCAKRNWPYLFRSRPGLPKNCPEIFIIPKLIKIIWAFPSKMRPAIMADLAATSKQVHIVHSLSELDQVVEKLMAT